MPRNRFLFVINPIAGGLDKKQYVDNLREKTAHYAAHLDIVETTGENDRERILDCIRNCNPDAVVAVGGDGTCNLVAGLLRETDCALGIVPLGSANGLATDLGIPPDVEEATELLFHGKETKIDGILINDEHLCLHLSDIGLNARVVKRFERQKSRGMLGYFRQYVTELMHMEPKRFEFELNGNRFKRRAHMVVIANSNKYGTGAIVNPVGKINDGKFEVCIIRPFPLWSIFALTLALFRGTLKKTRFVKIISCKKIKVFNKPKEVVQVDGEVIGEPKVVTAEILSGAFSIIVPQSFQPQSFNA